MCDGMEMMERFAFGPALSGFTLSAAAPTRSLLPNRSHSHRVALVIETLPGPRYG